MSKYQTLPKETLDGMTKIEVDNYWNMMELKHIRDEYAMAALTGLISNENWINNIDDTVDDAYVIADAMMEERIK